MRALPRLLRSSRGSMRRRARNSVSRCHVSWRIRAAVAVGEAACGASQYRIQRIGGVSCRGADPQQVTSRIDREGWVIIMMGWRARIGFLVPPGNPTVEPEMSELAPNGVSLHFTRMTANGPAGTHEGQEDRNRSQIESIESCTSLLAM